MEYIFEYIFNASCKKIKDNKFCAHGTRLPEIYDVGVVMSVNIIGLRRKECLTYIKNVKREEFNNDPY